MVCQNCQSTDIVSIQGQNYCINCGQMVVGAAAPVATKLPTPVKTKPASVKNPQPNITSIQKTVPTTITKLPITSTPPKVNPKTKPIQPSPKKTTPSTHRTAPITRPPVINDLRPIAKNPTTTPVTTTTPVSVIPAPAQPVNLPPQAKLANPPKVLSSVATSLKRLSHPGFVFMGLATSLIGLLPAGIIWLPSSLQPLNGVLRDVITSSQPWQISLPQDLWLRVLTILLAYLLLAFILRTILKNAISYGSAKLKDNRSVHHSVWIQSGTSSLWPSVRLDILAVIGLAMAALATIGLISIIGLWIKDDLVYHVTSIVAWGVAAYIGMGIVISHQIGKTILVLSQSKVFKSLELGWNLWRKQPALLFSSFSIILFSHLVAITALIASGTLIGKIKTSFIDSVLLQTALFLIICICLATWLSIFNRAFWASLTADLVRTHFPDWSANLLSGRSGTPRRLNTWLIIFVAITLLSVIAYTIMHPLPISLPRVWTGPII